MSFYCTIPKLENHIESTYSTHLLKVKFESKFREGLNKYNVITLGVWGIWLLILKYICRWGVGSFDIVITFDFTTKKHKMLTSSLHKNCLITFYLVSSIFIYFYLTRFENMHVMFTRKKKGEECNPTILLKGSSTYLLRVHGACAGR